VPINQSKHEHIKENRISNHVHKYKRNVLNQLHAWVNYLFFLLGSLQAPLMAEKTLENIGGEI
jgi:hypothetical protein